jgi:hypothetical protein
MNKSVAMRAIMKMMMMMMKKKKNVFQLLSK